jgi:hypothetical protein
MRRCFSYLALGLIVLGWAPTARGDWWARFWHNVGRDFKRNNSWPEPFIGPDRQAVLTHLNMATDQGWRVYNTLNEYHFDIDSNQLNEAGRLKIRGILTENPPEYRTVFVLRGDTPETTQARIDAAQQAASKLAYGGELPEVLETATRPRMASAETVDQIGRKYHASTPEPRLPKAEAEESEN